MMRPCVMWGSALIALAFSSGGAQGGDTAATTFMVGPIRVIHQLRSTAPTVAVRLYLLGGARQVDARNAGMEPLVLHTAGLGSAGYPGSESASALDRSGAATYVEVSDDWVVYGLHARRVGFDSAWAVFADRIRHPELTDQGIADSRRRMLARISVLINDPDYVLGQIGRPIAYANHPYANDPAGTDRTLRAIRPTAVREYHASQFVASRMLLSVVGNIDRATIENVVAATLARLPAGSYTWAPPPAVPLKKSSMTIIPRDGETDYIIGIFPGPATSSRDYGAFRLGTGLLGAYLNYEVRENEQLSYAAYAPLYDNLATSGALYASTPKPERVMELMVKEIEQVGSNALPFQLIPRFASQFEIEGLVARETNAGQAGALARAFLTYGDLTAVDASFRALREVSAGNLRSVVARFVPSVQWIFMGDTSRFRKYVR